MSTEGGPDDARRPASPPLLVRHLAAFRRVARAHDYACVGLEHVPEGPCLLVGYHGTPAVDAFLLATLLHELRGAAPRGIAHTALLGTPGIRRLARGLGMIDGSDAAVREALAQGASLLVLPGGSRECFRSSRTRYVLDWGRRQGYARLALRHGLPILPFASSGADELYRVHGDGYALSKRLTGTDLLPLCLPLGHRGLPFGPPRPVPLLTRVAPALPPEGDAEALDRRTRAAVEGLLSEIRAGITPAGRLWRLPP